MTAITAEMVKVLRDKTGAGIMDVKKALSEAEGDMEKAGEILRQKGIASADKKSGRSTSEGLVSSKISDDQKTGVLVEVNSETDFVARNESFVEMTDKLSVHVLNTPKATITEVLSEKCNFGSDLSVDEYVKENIGVIKENLAFRRFAKIQVKGAGLVKSYIHTGGKIGVLLALGSDNDAAAKKPEFEQLAKDLTLHVASSAPEFVATSDISPEVIANERRVEMGKEDLQSKPEEVRAKIVEGRVQKLLAQRVLLEQPFVKDPSRTIAQVIEDTAKTVGGKVEVEGFFRFVLGEEVAGEAQPEMAAV